MLVTVRAKRTNKIKYLFEFTNFVLLTSHLDCKVQNGNWYWAKHKHDLSAQGDPYGKIIDITL